MLARRARIALVIAVALTVVAWLTARHVAERIVAQRFEQRATDLSHAIEHRLSTYEQVLVGATALFAASDEVTREEWYRYVSALRLSRAWPGVLGIGYSVRIPPGRIDAHRTSVRAEGLIDYDVRPSMPRDEAHAVLYIEPFEGRNREVLGFDLASEPVRREALERARDTGRSTITGALTLLQDSGPGAQRAFVMMAPVYRKDALIDDEAQRRGALIGHVFAPFRIVDLMKGILGTGPSNLRFQLFDDAIGRDGALFHDSHADDGAPAPDARTQDLRIEVGGRVWTARYIARPDFAASLETALPLLVATCGFAVDLLIASVLLSALRMGARAEKLAAERTRELERSRRQLGAITDSASAAILTADRHGTIVQTNPAAEAMFGYRGDTLVGRAVASLLATHRDWPEHRAALRRIALARRAGATLELNGLHRSGTTLALEVSLSRWRVDGEAFVTVIARDISERKAAEQHRDDFLAMVSHEIRTPLTTVVAPLALLAEGSAGALPPQAHRLVSMASQNAARLGRLAKDILDAKRLETGQITLDVRTLNLVAFAERALALNAALLDNHGVSGRLDEPEEPLRVRADGDKLLQVMTNLMSNAAKFSPPGSTVVVRLARVRDRARLSVVDRGCGIPAEYQSRIFERFVRVPRDDGRAVDGAGLGLAICRALVEGMGGTITFDSRPNVGTAFHVDLPLAEPVDAPIPDRSTSTA